MITREELNEIYDKQKGTRTVLAFICQGSWDEFVDELLDGEALPVSSIIYTPIRQLINIASGMSDRQHHVLIKFMAYIEAITNSVYEDHKNAKSES